VTVAFEDKDKVFNIDLWPRHVLVRDWYFKHQRNESLASADPVSSASVDPSDGQL